MGSQQSAVDGATFNQFHCTSYLFAFDFIICLTLKTGFETMRTTFYIALFSIGLICAYGAPGGHGYSGGGGYGGGGHGGGGGCKTVNQQKCYSTSEQQCSTVTDQQCSTVNEQQ